MKISKLDFATGKKTSIEKKIEPSSEIKSAQKNPPEMEKRANQQFPTRFELAQIAAVLTGKENLDRFEPDHIFGEDKISVPDAALGLWQRCGRTLWKAKEFAEQMDEIRELEDIEYNIPEWCFALEREIFPLAFDRSLEIIMGRKKRRDDRHKAFRDFLYDYYRKAIKEVPQAESEAEKRFAELKLDGFSEKVFEKTAQLLPEWRSKQAKEKARKAAEKRWGKKKQK